MPDLRVEHITRTSVILAWDSLPQAIAYSVKRAGPYRRGAPPVDPANVILDILAASYTGTYCDTTLEAGCRYVFHVEMIIDLDAPPLFDTQGQPVRVEDEMEVPVWTQPDTEFPDGRTFFTEFVAPTFHRLLDQNTYRWCEDWWSHPEVAYVVDQLWAAYEAMRPPDAPGSVPAKHRAEWLISYFYPLLDRMLLSKGPFEGCSINERENDGKMHNPRARPLPHRPDPLGEYRVDRDPALTMTP